MPENGVFHGKNSGKKMLKCGINKPGFSLEAKPGLLFRICYLETE